MQFFKSINQSNQNEIFKKKSNLLLAVVVILNATILNAQENSEEKLESEILEMDRLLFEEAFNKCDLELYLNIVCPELEFYDDRTGLNTDFDKEVDSFKSIQKCI